MGFTVVRPGGASDVEFQAYARLLRKSRVDLGHARRVREPETGRHWFYVWDKRE